MTNKENTNTDRTSFITLNKEKLICVELELRHMRIDIFNEITDLIEMDMIFQIGMIFPEWRDKLKEKYPNQFEVIGGEPAWVSQNEKKLK